MRSVGRGLLESGGGAARWRWPDNVAASRVAFGAFVVGLACSVTLSQGALIVLTILWLWRLRDPAARAAQPWPLAWPVLTFLTVMLISLLASGYPARGFVVAKGLLCAAALYVTVDVLATTERAERFLLALAAVCGVAALAGLVQVATCPEVRPTQWPLSRFYYRCDRARGPFSIYMTLGGVLATVLVVTLPRVLPGGRGPRWLLVPWLLMLGALASTYVRGAWLGFGAGAAALLATLRRGRWLLLLGIFVLVAGALFGPERVSRRLRSMGDPEEVTIRERRLMWSSGLAIWRDHPWLGVGPGGVKRLYRQYARPEAIKQQTSHLHNSPLQILAEVGVLGLAAWLWIWLAFFVFCGRLLRRLRGPGWSRERALVSGSLAAIVGFLVTGLSEWSFGDSEVVLIAWTLMALPWVVARDLDRRLALDPGPAPLSSPDQEPALR
jgi:O-antigen ligase